LSVAASRRTVSLSVADRDADRSPAGGRLPSLPAGRVGADGGSP